MIPYSPEMELAGPSSPAPADAPVRSLLAFLSSIQSDAKNEVVVQDGLRRFYTGAPMAWFNGVLVTRPAGEGSILQVAQAQAYFRGKGVPAMTWWFGNDPELQGWRNVLETCGFVVDQSTPGMTANLDDLAPLHLPAGLTIETVDTPAALADWSRTSLVGFNGDETGWQSFSTLVEPMNPGRYRGYLGRLDGCPVATSAMFLGAGVAGIYMVATIPEARKRGFAAAMTLQPLLDARAIGYRTGVLQASKMGRPVYERIGFAITCGVDIFTCTL